MIPETVVTQVKIQHQHTDRAWHATLPNGRNVIAFRDVDEPALALSAGQYACAELRVTDFSQAHIIE